MKKIFSLFSIRKNCTIYVIMNFTKGKFLENARFSSRDNSRADQLATEFRTGFSILV